MIDMLLSGFWDHLLIDQYKNQTLCVTMFTECLWDDFIN